LLFYDRTVIAWCIWNGGYYSCDVSILWGMGMYMFYSWTPWMLMFNCELWTNPQWSFGWPPSLSVWMGRWCAGIVCFALVSCLRIAWILPRLLHFGVLDFRAMIRGWSSLFIFTLSVRDLRLYIDDDMSCMMTWLLGELYYIWMTVEIFYLCVDVMMFYSVAMFWEICYLCMLGDLVQDVTSRFLICRIISVIYRFESLGCYKVVHKRKFPTFKVP